MTPVMGRIKEGELRKLSIHGSVHGQFTLTEDCLQYGHSVSTDLPTCHAPNFHSLPNPQNKECSYPIVAIKDITVDMADSSVFTIAFTNGILLRLEANSPSEAECWIEEIRQGTLLCSILTR